MFDWWNVDEKRTTDGYLEQDIDRDIYRTEKAKLLSEKKSLEEQNTKLEQKQNDWLEPMSEWIKDAEILDETAKNDDLPSKKLSLQKIFGSNLSLTKREAFGIAQNEWFSLANAKEKISKNGLITTLEYIYDSARTYFIKNS